VVITITKTSSSFRACIIELSRAFVDGHMLDFLQNLIQTDC